MGVYDVPIATAKRLIGRFGKTGQIRYISKGADASEPWKKDTETSTDVSVRVVVLDYDNRMVDGEVVKIGDRRALVAADDALAGAVAEPDQDDLLLVDGQVLKIIKPNPLRPGPDDVLFTLQVRT